MLQIKKIKPIGCQVLVTENLYGWDDENAAGVIIHTKGDLKNYQQVIAVGDDVSFVKPGDTVKINFYKYANFKEDPNSIKAVDGNHVVSLTLNEVEIMDDKNEPVSCMLIDQRDIEYILEEFDEVKYAKDDTLIKIAPATNKIILPSYRIKI